MRSILRREMLLVAAALVVAGCQGGRGRSCCPPRCMPCGPATRVACGTPATALRPLPAPAVPVKRSGFLSDYGRLKPNPERAGAWFWAKEGLDLRGYDSLVIDPIQVVAAGGTAAASLTDEQKAKVTDRFRQILLDRVDPYYPVVDEAAPHVLHVRIALTDLQPLGEAEEGEPPVTTGGAELEAQILDGPSGELLLELASRIEGSDRGAEDVPEAWRPIEGAFREWADRLLDFLDTHTE